MRMSYETQLNDYKGYEIWRDKPDKYEPFVYDVIIDDNIVNSFYSLKEAKAWIDMMTKED